MQYVRPVDFGAFRPSDFHSQRIADPSTGLDSCICICTRVPPGTGTTAGLHTHPADQIYYVLTGTMHADIAGTTYEVKPHSLVYIPRGTAHWNWNAGAEDEVHFELIVPPPPPGQPTSTPAAKRPEPAATSGTLDVIRRLDHAKFKPDRFSSVVLADRASGVGSVSMGVFRTPAGGRAPDLHVHRFDQIYYVISGTLRVRIGFEEYSAGPNTLVILPAGMPHTNWNDGPEPEYHLNLRVPEPPDRDVPWDVPVHFGTVERQA